MDYRLNAGERSVLSSFRSLEEAEMARRKICSLGIEEECVSVAQVASGPHGESQQHWPPIPGAGAGLASLVSDTAVGWPDTSILQAANPVNSGMADGWGTVTGYNWCLTVVTPEALVERVVRVIKDGGGYT